MPNLAGFASFSWSSRLASNDCIEDLREEKQKSQVAMDQNIM